MYIAEFPQISAKNAARFWAKVNKTPNGCWEWIGCRSGRGYGNLTISSKNYKAHRVSYFMAHGECPSDRLVCHSCDNPPCVNPAHLFLGTHTDNTQDCERKHRRNAGKGEANPRALLTNEQAKMIFQMRNVEKHSLQEIAALFGITPYQVSKIARGHSYKWVNDPTQITEFPLDGERHPHTHLRDTDIPVIRQLRSEKLTLRAIGDLYCITESAVHNICSRKSWAHIP